MRLLHEGRHEGDYFDEKGKRIKEFDLVKMLRENYFLYKWVRQIELDGKWTWIALNLSDDSGDYFRLRDISNTERVLNGVEIVEQSPLH